VKTKLLRYSCEAGDYSVAVCMFTESRQALSLCPVDDRILPRHSYWFRSMKGASVKQPPRVRTFVPSSLYAYSSADTVAVHYFHV
jgi:hypothetical protein